MEQSELDLDPQQASVEQTNNLATHAKKSLVPDAAHSINVHLLEDGIDNSVLERANVTEATSSTQNAAQNEVLLNPRNSTVFNLEHTNIDGYESQAFLQQSHDNAIDIVESDDEHLELKQSAHSKIPEPAKTNRAREGLKQTGVTSLQNESNSNNQGQPKRKRDTPENRPSPNFVPFVARSQAEDKITSIVDRETKTSPIFSSDQQFNNNNKQPDGIQSINGVVYNDRGYEICGHMNQHNKPCQRIGNCPFHGQSLPKRDVSMTKATSLIEERHEETRIEHSTLEEPLKQVDKETQHTENHFNQELHSNEDPTVPDVAQNPEYFARNTFTGKKTEVRTEAHQSENGLVKKVPFKQGWSREEHIRFLIGLSWYGKGAWKEISSVVVTRSPTQIQSHAQKYFLRQRQPSKNKKSIHDITMDDLQEMSADTKQSYLLQSQRQQNTPLTNAAPFPPAPPQIAKDVSSSTQPAPEVRTYPNTAPYPVNQYPTPTHYQPQGPSAYQYSFPSGQSQLQVPVIPNPQPPPSASPVYTTNPVYPHSMPYPQQAPFPPPQQIPPSVHYGYQPPPTYPPPHIVSNSSFPPPIPPQHWTQPPPAYQMPPGQFPQQFNYLPNNPPSMPYPNAPYPSFPPNSNTMFSSNYLPQDPNRSTFTTNTNNPTIYQPSWPNPQSFPVEQQQFPQQDSALMKDKTNEDDKLQDENVSEHHEDTFDDHFVDSSPSNSFEISDMNDQQTHDISQNVSSFPEDTQKYLL